MTGIFHTFDTLEALQSFEDTLVGKAGFVRPTHYVPFKGKWLLAIETDVGTQDIVTSAAIDYLTDALNGSRGEVEQYHVRCEYGNLVSRTLAGKYVGDTCLGKA